MMREELGGAGNALPWQALDYGCCCLDERLGRDLDERLDNTSRIPSRPMVIGQSTLAQQLISLTLRQDLDYIA